VEFEIGDPGGTLDVEVVAPGRAFHLAAGTVHRVRALEDTVLLEVSTPETEDVVRLEDRYGRADG
jgi:quercetin dioxygenase-like cupin family protein